MTSARRHSGRRHHTAYRGFTLVEVMISIALVLILILGINQVFRITSQTVSAGQALSAAVRDSRAVQTVLYNDLQKNNQIQNGPMLIIRNTATPAFTRRADELSDRDYSTADVSPQREQHMLTIDLDANNIEGETGVLGEGSELNAWYKYNQRNHRTDIFGFFSNGTFHRQTGNMGSLTSPTGSNEAFIWYGHLLQPDKTGSFLVPTMPGEATFSVNSNNFYASDFLLGRFVMLLKDEPLAEDHITITPPPTGVTRPLAPLEFESWSTDVNEPQRRIDESRYDLAGVTIQQFTQRLQVHVPTEEWWWQRLLMRPQVNNYTTPNASPYTNATSPPFRYQAEKAFKTPLDSAKASKLSPVLLNGCSQFIVEFAGNFFRQDPINGNPLATYDQPVEFSDPTTGQPDTETDFVIEQLPSGDRVKRIRWYGMWRDSNGDGNPRTGPSADLTFTDQNNNPQVIGPDVQSVSEVRNWAQFGRGGSYGPTLITQNLATTPPPLPGPPYPPTVRAPFERELPDISTNPPIADYIAVWGPLNMLDAYDTDPLTPAVQAPVIDPVRPTMLRIRFTIEDPTGRLPEGQTYEYIINVQ